MKGRCWKAYNNVSQGLYLYSQIIYPCILTTCYHLFYITLFSLGVIKIGVYKLDDELYLKQWDDGKAHSPHLAEEKLNIEKSLEKIKIGKLHFGGCVQDSVSFTKEKKYINDNWNFLLKKNFFWFSYNCLHFLPIPPPHPSQFYLPPPPLPSPLILSLWLFKKGISFSNSKLL